VKPDPKLAKKFAEQGAKLEAGGRYEEALAAYQEAARYAPFDVTIVSKGVALRSKLVRGYVDSAERLALDGNYEGATLQLAAALRIDPGNTIVEERLHQLQAQNEVKKEVVREEPPIGLPKLEPLKATRSFNLQTDVRSAYEQVAAAYGIKASFDPDLPSRTVRLRLSEVDFETAMKVMTAETGTFWRPANSHLIFVAADTTQKRREFDLEIEQTFALPATMDSADLTELVRVVRELTGVQHVQQSLSSRTITIRDTVQRARLAGEILRELEQSRGEVILEIDLLEVNRNNATNLGIVPPSGLRLVPVSAGLAQQLRSAPSLTALLTLLASIFGGPIGAAASRGLGSLASAIPPIAAIGGGKTTFLLALPSISANFSQALSLVQSGQQVLLRAQDGKPATFFVGDRYPITLSFLSGSLGSTNFIANPSGTGVIIPTQQFTVGRSPVALVTADFRLAGTQDLAVLNEIDNSISILLNQGANATTQFAQPTGSPISIGQAQTTTPIVPASLAVGSLNTVASPSNPNPNGDNFPDLLATDPVADTVTVVLQNAAGDGTFTVQKNPISVGRQPSAIVVGAFNTKNGDSNFGFVVINFTDSTYSVFNGNGNGTFTQVKGSPFALPNVSPNSEVGPIAMATADFNGDGIPDLAIVNQTSGTLTVLQGNGDGTFKEFPGSPYTVGNDPVAIAYGTLSGSTGPALAIANQKDRNGNSAGLVTVLLGKGDGTFVASSQSPLSTTSPPNGIVIGSFVQQSSLSQSTSGIAVTNTSAGTVTVFVDLGAGLVTKALEPAAGNDPWAILAGNFTSSTFPDLVVTNNLPTSSSQTTNGLVTLIVSPTSLISNPAQNQQPYPGSQYEDIGLKIKATPSLHANGEVTLQLDFDIKALTGTTLNGIPVISNRSLTQTVRLKEDETSLLTGLLDDQTTKSITGIPGLAPLPGLGYAFGTRSNSLQDSELLFLITPRRVRIPLREARSLYAGPGDVGGRSSVGALAPQLAPPSVPPPVEQPETQPVPAPPMQQPVPQEPPPQGQPPPQN
jgi:type II secretory pathway component GspD/PulD (secretin)